MYLSNTVVDKTSSFVRFRFDEKVVNFEFVTKYLFNVSESSFSSRFPQIFTKMWLNSSNSRVVLIILLMKSILIRAEIMGNLYLRLCYLLRMTSYCLPDGNSIPYQVTAFAQSPTISPSTVTAPFTFPTIFRIPNQTPSSGSMGPTFSSSPQPPIQSFPQKPQNFPIVCPPTISICPIGITAPLIPIPNIDPRVFLRDVNGCPCIDTRGMSPVPGAFPSSGIQPIGSIGNSPFPLSPTPTAGGIPISPGFPIGGSISPSPFPQFGAFPSLGQGGVFPPNNLLRAGETRN